MKTKLKIIILLALALIIQEMVNGQTQGNQASNNKNIDVSQKRTYTTFGTYNPKTQTSQPVQAKESNSTSVTDHQTHKSNLVSSGSISSYNKSLLSKATAKDAKELLYQADEMIQLEKDLRGLALSKKGDEKTKLLQSANELSKQIELIQIQASEINGKISLETYNFNKKVYIYLLSEHLVNQELESRSEELSSDADQIIKLAKEMRQEAYAMPTNAAKLGTMLNAEEKESIALTKQNEAIGVLNKTSHVVMAAK